MARIRKFAAYQNLERPYTRVSKFTKKNFVRGGKPNMKIIKFEMGDPKGKAFGCTVDELDVLREDEHNPHALKLFADMSCDELKQAIRVVVQIPDEQIRQIIIGNGGRQSLAEKMIARKADLATRLQA